jgi:1-acyl-sn-glycerol-3-phosphate acyltransferase
VAAARIPGFPERFPVRSDDRKSLRYTVVSFLSRLFFRVVFGGALHIEGDERLPETGPVVVVCNHLSNLDPFVFGGFSKRTMFCMAKRELFRPRVVAWLLAGCNCFPVDRGSADRQALRTALDLLAGRGRLLIFVEGTRARTPGMKRAEAGVGFLVRRSGAPVLPVAIWGTEESLARGRRFPRRVPVRVQYGSVVPAGLLAGAGGRNDRALADAIAQHVADLLPPEYRGVYGGRATA